jgi:hypothetical protein
MGTIGDCYDNAAAESFFATLKTELLSQRTSATRAGSRRARRISLSVRRSRCASRDGCRGSAPSVGPDTSRSQDRSTVGRPTRRSGDSGSRRAARNSAAQPHIPHTPPLPPSQADQSRKVTTRAAGTCSLYCFLACAPAPCRSRLRARGEIPNPGRRVGGAPRSHAEGRRRVTVAGPTSCELIVTSFRHPHARHGPDERARSLGLGVPEQIDPRVHPPRSREVPSG